MRHRIVRTEQTDRHLAKLLALRIHRLCGLRYFDVARPQAQARSRARFNKDSP